MRNYKLRRTEEKKTTSLILRSLALYNLMWSFSLLTEKDIEFDH